MVIAWTKCFLLNRSQFVKVGHCSSSPYDVLSGVPQGSVLGRVLFILFVNDICNIVPSGVNLKLFADDVKLYSVINSTVTPNSLHACLSAVYGWSEHCQLKLSPAKCTVLHVSPHSMTNRTMFDYFIGDTALPWCPVNHIFVLLLILIRYHTSVCFTNKYDGLIEVCAFTWLRIDEPIQCCILVKQKMFKYSYKRIWKLC